MKWSAEILRSLPNWTVGFVLALVLSPVVAPQPVRADDGTPRAPRTALDRWTDGSGIDWTLQAILEEVDSEALEAADSADAAVGLVADSYSLAPDAAADLLEAVLLTAGLDEEIPGWPDLETVAKRMAEAAERLDEPADRYLFEIRFYGALPEDIAGSESVRAEIARLVTEIFESEEGTPGLLEDLWPEIDDWGLADRELIESLLAASPGHPALLGELAKSEWDDLNQAAIHLHLWRSGASAEPFRALMSLTEAGVESVAVDLWHSLTADVATEVWLERLARAVEQEPSEEWLTQSTRALVHLPEALAVGLWLEGHPEEAAELIATLDPFDPGPAPDLPPTAEGVARDHAAWSRYYREERRWNAESAPARRRQLVEEALRPSGRDPYELAVDLLRTRDRGLYSYVLQGAMWPRLAAAWARRLGRGELERYFLVQARRESRFQPTELTRGQNLFWRHALDEGLIPVELYALREELYLETERNRHRDLERILALADTTAGFFEPGAQGGRGAYELRFSPWTVRQQPRNGAADDAVESMQEPSDDVLPPTLPVEGDRVVDLARDGGRWWVLHGGDPEIAHSDWQSRGYYLSTSDDGGHTWTPPVHTGVVANAPLEVIRGSFTAESGRLRLLAREAIWTGGMLIVHRSDELPFYELEVDPADLWADGDGDGWSDVLERGLFTDPESDDTDGDGLPDPVDPLPVHDGEPSEESRALDAAVREMVEPGQPLERLLLAAADEAPPEPVADESLLPVRLMGPELPFAVLGMPLQLFLLPEELAQDESVGGQLDVRIRLWMTNRAVDRAVLVWTGQGVGGQVEVARSERGWYAVAGQRSGGCLTVSIEPPSEELLRRHEWLLPSPAPKSIDTIH